MMDFMPPVALLAGFRFPMVAAILALLVSWAVTPLVCRQ